MTFPAIGDRTAIEPLFDDHESCLFYYIEAFYNQRRLHSALGYVSPDVYEWLYHQGVDIP